VSTVRADTRREPRLGTAVFILVATVAVAASTIGGRGTHVVPVLAAFGLLLVLWHEQIFAWRTQLSLIVLAILFIPIKRYTLEAHLPFNLEIYRLLVAVLFVCWFTSLLIDPRVSLRASGLEAPLWGFVVAILLSLMANTARVGPLSTSVVKSVTFFVSYVLVFYAIVSLVRSARDIDFLVSLLAAGGAVLGFLAVVESATGQNIFNHLTTAIPVLHFDASQVPHLSRGGRLRVYGSGQHPIAFGAALAMLLPFAVYRAASYGQKRWWFAAFLILLGTLATRSRTATVMLLAILLVYIILRPSTMKRLWPAILPGLIAIHFALPGAIGTATSSFAPQGGLIAQQQNASVGSGRIATLGPALAAEFDPNPTLGEGFATRITGRPQRGQPPPNAPILDDGWLGILLETGIVGTTMLVWLFARSLRLMGVAAKRDRSPRGWLLVSTTAAVAGYFVGMFTYDAFSFIQSTFLLFIVLGIGAAARLSPTEQWERLADVRKNPASG
jgi:polysaccharide biosynthesis protein PslJ